MEKQKFMSDYCQCKNCLMEQDAACPRFVTSDDSVVDEVTRKLALSEKRADVWERNAKEFADDLDEEKKRRAILDHDLAETAKHVDVLRAQLAAAELDRDGLAVQLDCAEDEMLRLRADCAKDREESDKMIAAANERAMNAKSEYNTLAKERAEKSEDKAVQFHSVPFVYRVG